MSSTVLARSDLALLSDPLRRVTMPRVSEVTPPRVWEGTVVRFVGDALPTPFRGEGRDGGGIALAVTYGRGEQQGLVDLLALLDLAASLVDTRLWLRTNYGRVAGLDFAGAVIVTGATPKPGPAQSVVLSLTAQPVAYSLSVA